MSNKSKSIKNLGFSFISEIVIIAIGIILPRFYIVSYGSEVSGLLNSAKQLVVYLGLFEAGLSNVTLQALYRPIAQDDRAGVNAVLAATHHYYKKAGLWYFFGLLLLSFGYSLIVPSDINYWTVCGVIFLNGINGAINFYLLSKYKILLQAEGKNYIQTNLSMILTTLTGVVRAVLITLGYDVITVLVATFLILLTETGYILWLIRREYQWIDLAVQPNWCAIAQRHYTLVHQIAGMVFQNTPILLVSMFCGLTAVSVYSIYRMIVTYLESVFRMLSNSVLFALGQLFQTDKDAYKTRIDTFESYYSAISFALLSVGMHLLVSFVRLYTVGISDANYIDPTLAFLLIIIALLSIVRTPALNTIYFAGHFKQTTIHAVLEAGINLVVSLLCVGQFGVYGVLFGSVVSLLYRTNQVIVYANKELLNRSPWHTYVIYIVNIAVFVLTQFIFHTVSLPVDSYLDFIVVGCAETIISLILFLGAQSIVFPKHLRFAVNVIKKK